MCGKVRAPGGDGEERPTDKREGMRDGVGSARQGREAQGITASPQAATVYRLGEAVRRENTGAAGERISG